MPDFTLITNCADPTVVFTTDLPLEGGLFISTDLIEIPDEITEGICITGLNYGGSAQLYPGAVWGEPYSDTFFSTPVGEYNGKTVYSFQITEEQHQLPGVVIQHYIVWDDIAELWYIWENFDIVTGPSCSNCCGENLPWMQLDNIVPVTGQGVDWELTPDQPCYNPIKSINGSTLCTQITTTPDFINCWQTSIINERAADLTGVEIIEVFPDCESCLYPDTALATNCETQEELQVQLPEDFFYEDGVVTTFEGREGCWTLTRTPYEESIEVVVDESFKDCEECLPPPPEPVEPVCGPLELHVLKSCNGTHPDILVKEDMTEFEGQVVWSEYFNGCFIVGEKEESFDTDYQVSFTIDRLHGNCLECLSYFEVEPDFDVPCCDEDKVQEVMCDFADKVHREIIAKRYGINTQDRTEYLKSWMRFESMKQQLRCLPHPPLPDPPTIPRFENCPKPDCSN